MIFGIWDAVIAGSATILVAGFFVLWWRRRIDFQRSLDFIFLQILVPKKESKEEYEKERDLTNEIRKVIGIGEHFFATLHGIYSRDVRNIFTNQDFLSLEYIATDGEIKFFMGCPRHLKSIIEKQITSFYPEAVIEECPAPSIFREKTLQKTAYLITEKKHWFPIKTYTRFESADPINNILNALSNASDEKGNSAAVQIMIRPMKDGWQRKVRHQAKKMSSGKKDVSWWNPFALLGNLFGILVRGAEEKPSDGGQVDSEESQEAIKAMEEKSEKVGFHTILRCVASSPDKKIAEMNINSIVNSFAQYGAPSINSFVSRKWHSQRSLIRNFLFRCFRTSWHFQKKIVLSPEELTSLFHFPHIKFNQVPAVKWQNYKIVKAPSNIPKEGLLLGHNVYRGEILPIYIRRDDRFRHFYVIGQTGTGKTSIFKSMIRQDLLNGEGFCVVDPHGSLIDDILPFVPRNRIDDVIIFDPSDLERPMGLNLLEAGTDEERDMVALDAMNIMLKLFDEEVFGPRIQDYFRNGCLTLMADPNGGALTDIVRLFTDDAFQRARVQHVKNPVVKSFWTKQMAQTGTREKQEMIPYFAAKFGAFVTNSMMRNIIGQTKSAFDFSKVMEEGKILLMNLSKGATGEINSKMLGLIIVSKLQMATMRRQKMLSGGQKPRDFFLYIDEFQNYVTESLESILSEARKYRLGLNIAHQYIGQIDQKDHKGRSVNLKDAVFGNVGTMMCYKIGAQDAEYMAKEMNPAFSDQDLINIDKYKAVMKLSIDTQPSKPFSIVPLNPYLEKGDDEIATALKQISRLTFGRSKKFVEKEIFARLDV
ncbi:type IV secretion system DNA-binding domain-containing protein [Candidatus Gracilibacteria bacterium]|nr:type IV secretion system DNA-binding domain-containing protein [Candidatus Gracilibacteria bacterium]